jgi:SAM-dependent methyltransferase
VSGRQLLHLQCHMGQDTLSWARLGAHVTGLDFSVEAIHTARALARDIGMAERARFVVSDVYEASAALAGERYDIVYTGFGSLVWLPDLTRWARTVASLLKDQGTLYLAEFHPLTEMMLGKDGKSVEQHYFQAEGVTSDSPWTYTEGPPLTETTSVRWQHPLGAVVTALAQAGLRIEFLHEHNSLLFQRYPSMERWGQFDYRFPADHPHLPLMYSIRASKGA